jgi:serine/threonine-protein kinase HipA
LLCHVSILLKVWKLRNTRGGSVLNLVVGNADAHAKNLALVLEAGYVTLAPLYDIVPTQLWPSLRRTLALTIADKDDPDAVVIDDLGLEAARWSFSKGAAVRLASETLEQIRDEVRTIEHERLSGLVLGNINSLIGRS